MNTNEHFEFTRTGVAFIPTPLELQKLYNTLEHLIIMRSVDIREEAEANFETVEEDDGYLDTYNSAF